VIFEALWDAHRTSRVSREILQAPREILRWGLTPHALGELND